MLKKEEINQILKILGLINNKSVKYTSDFMLLSPSEHGKNEKIIHNYFKEKYG